MATKFNHQAGAGIGTCVASSILQQRQTQKKKQKTLTEKAITETHTLYKRRSNFALQTEHQPKHLTYFA